MTKLNIENPKLLAQHVQDYLTQKIQRETLPPPFTCEVVVVLGGNIIKSGDRFITTPYEKGTTKSFGAQGRVITAALLYHLGVSDCLLLSTGKTDPENPDAPSEASVMKAELLVFGVPEPCMHLEENSRTTEENARELVKLLTTEPFKEKQIIGVITSSWHIRRTDAFLKREGIHAAGRTIKYISSDTMICRYLPEFRGDIHVIYQRQEMKDRIQDERNGYNALKKGTYKSRKLGETWS
jgi:vancomycin permeability regulator SanA